MVYLAKIKRIGKISSQKLKWAGIDTVEILLERGSTRRDRQIIAGETGISSKRILEWVNHVDLFRISGVGEDYALLLEAAGVNTILELSQRDPEELTVSIAFINQENDLVRRQPALAVVKRWVKEAKKLPQLIEY